MDEIGLAASAMPGLIVSQRRQPGLRRQVSCLSVNVSVGSERLLTLLGKGRNSNGKRNALKRTVVVVVRGMP